MSGFLPVRDVALVPLLAFFAAEASAGGSVRLVSGGGVTAFTEIQPAVDAAQDGDLILVGDGTYAPVDIRARSLAIFAMPGAAPTVRDHLRIEDVGAGQAVVVHGLRMGLVDGELEKSKEPSLIVSNCKGWVRLQDCDVAGMYFWLHVNGCPFAPGFPGADVRAADSIALIGCWISGNSGSKYVSGMSGCQPFPGGPGLQVAQSRLVVHDSSVYGALGTSAPYPSHGGPGLLTLGDSVVDSLGGVFEGGPGGLLSYPPFVPSAGGRAGQHDGRLWRSTGTGLKVGIANPGGPPVVGSGVFLALPGEPRRLDAAAFAAAGAQATVTLTGVPGDAMLPVASQAMGHHLVEAARQVWLGAWPFHQLTPPAATVLPASGVSSTSVFLPPLAGGQTHATLTLQAKVSSAQGLPALSSARIVLTLAPNLGPDCDGSGLGDLYEIAVGLAPDANHNLIPDTCPGG